MKNLIRNLPFFALSLLLMTACGNNQPVTCAVGQMSTPQGCVANQQAYGSGYQTGYNNNGSNCPANQINTQLGCLAQGGPCMQGQGWDPRYNQCYPAIAGNYGQNYGQNNGQYNPAYVGGSFGANIGLPAGGQYNSCQPGYAQTAQGCQPRCSFNYNGGMCVNY